MHGMRAGQYRTQAQSIDRVSFYLTLSIFLPSSALSIHRAGQLLSALLNQFGDEASPSRSMARASPCACVPVKIPEVQPQLRAVHRASIVARENANRVILRTEEDKLILTAESQIVGNAYEEIEVVRDGENVEIAFNSKYLLDVLNVMDAETVYLELTEALKPGLLRPIPARIKADKKEVEPEREGGKELSDEVEDDTSAESGYLCVLMPMQIV